MDTAKRCAEDFVFHRIIGEGSFSVVYLARDVHTKCLCAVKVCEKSHIHREKMHKAILREKQIMKYLTEKQSKFIIKLLSTFQDDTRLFFVLNYCVNGELLSFINQREIFDHKATLFYAAEILLALEHLHRYDIVHRDLKPENILLNEKMHIQITDFGSAFFLNDPTGEKNDPFDAKYSQQHRSRKNSFVGTAQYVSPEMLTNKNITGMCDLWAWACMLYQMITSSPPFSGSNEYSIFQKIQNLDYKFPENFPDDAKELIESILKIDPTQRLGADDDIKSNDGYISIRNHRFFHPLNNDWNLLNKQPPQQLLAVARNDVSIEELCIEFESMNLAPGLNEKQITRLLCLSLHQESDSFKPNNANNCDNNKTNNTTSMVNKRRHILDITAKEFEERLRKQKETNKFHPFVENNLIIKQGLIDKKKGFFPRRRMFLLTTGPHIYYVDPANMVLKGEVPFCKEMRTEAKNFRNFYIHVPNRTYILEDITNNAPGWCEIIDEVKKHALQDQLASAAAATIIGGDEDGLHNCLPVCFCFVFVDHNIIAKYDEQQQERQPTIRRYIRTTAKIKRLQEKISTTHFHTSRSSSSLSNLNDQQSNETPISIIECNSDSESPTRFYNNNKSNPKSSKSSTPEPRMKNSDRISEIYSRQLSSSANKSNFLKHSSNSPLGHHPFNLSSASSKLTELIQSMSPKMLTFSSEVDMEFDELSSIAKTFKSPIISKTESINMKGSMNKLENKMLNLCKELVQNRNNVDILLMMTDMIRKAWSVPQCGYDLGFNMSKTIRETGAIEALLCNIESDDEWKVQFSSAQLLEQCLVSENRDYVVEHGLEKVVCTAKECVNKKQPDEVVVGVGILEHLFKHSENTCKEVIKLNGLETILYECRSTNIETLRHCASALANLSLYGGPDSQESMIKLKAAMWLFPLAFHNNDNIKYYACLAITVLVANQELEAEVIKSGTLDLCEPFVMSHNPEEFAKSSISHIHGQSKNWLARLVPVLMSKREEARSLAAFHFAMEAWIKKTQEQAEIFREINAVNALKKVASCPNAIASKYAAQALRLIGEEVPHKLSQQVPLWTIEDVKEWVKQIGFGLFCQEFEKSRVDGDILLQLNEHMLHDDIGIKNGILRKRFMRELANLKQITDYSSCDPTNLAAILSNLGPEYTRYTYSLLHGGIDKNTLTVATDDILIAECNIDNTIHRMKILLAVENLKKCQPIVDSSKDDNDPDKTLDVFISYRRSNGSQLASLLKVHLQLRGFSVFLDVERLEAGKFDNNLLNSIRQAKHFLLVLTPNALDRCINDDEQKDWVHREIAQALLTKCNIIPIMESFQWPEPDQLPDDIKPICHFNGIRWIHDYQEACVDKLERFMRGEYQNSKQSQDCCSGSLTGSISGSHRYGLPHGLPPTPNTPGIRSPSQQRRSCSVDNVRHQQSSND
ncbi:Sterile alpha and TIR motif-containing protein 1 [Dermatophagoides farinae]|uniref:3-phosphoinositide-dependent protein kinase 1 n=1 Tax=Dermatophagoides farinae TaxID=6954 RepID=A0A922HPR7_DERFA|nr:Sterile alpha and TIR motif-containing protein 1 [Dermatophagoides farinae]